MKDSAILPTRDLAVRLYGNDAPWFEANIPFFECADPEIERIYYYRWQLYKAHIRDIGARGYVITEFLDDVGWQKSPYASLNDATGFHIYEGRWLKDPSYVDRYIDFMYEGGGNDRHFSEYIADATYANYLVRFDPQFATKHLSAMRHIYNVWDDHYDFSKDLYFIEPIADATEYTISSIDATGGEDGFLGGNAFRPTINSYMFANANAISKLSELAGDHKTASDYASRAEHIKDRVQQSLWNDKLGHFTDRYQVNNQHVRYWDFIRGRELAGYVPWYFNLPSDDRKYATAWSHLLTPEGFQGPYGLRTSEPSYVYYMRQYRYLGSQPECQWNGPSWPYQTTQVLGAMANLLNSYHQNLVTRSDYLRILKQYAEQHVLDGKPDLQEDYNPDKGGPIVGLDRSHHYNHSGYIDLIVTGLVGLRPRADDVLEVNPLIVADPKAPGYMPFFCLDGVSYHGHSITVLFDADGKKYDHGAGLSVFVDGKREIGPTPLGRQTCKLSGSKPMSADGKINLAVNIYRRGYPSPSASVRSDPSLFGAIDGRSWFFDNVPNGWTTAGNNATDWFALDFGQVLELKALKLYFYDDGKDFFTPAQYKLEYWKGDSWTDIPDARRTPANPIGNGENDISFPSLKTDKIRVVFTHAKVGAQIRLVEFRAF